MDEKDKMNEQNAQETATQQEIVTSSLDREKHQEEQKEDVDGLDQHAFDITEKFKKSKPQTPPIQKSTRIGVTDKKMETKRILIFLAFCFGATWLMELFGVIPMYQSKDSTMVKEAITMIPQIMFAPALAAIIARLLTREGLVKSGFQFNFAEHKFLFLFGWFGTTLLIGIGAVLYFIVFKDNFDPNMTVFVSTYEAASGTDVDPVSIVASYKANLLIKIFTAPILGVVGSFGQEWGFRGYLLPKLFRKIGPIPAILISGFASGLWYAPLVYIGYYYGGDNQGFPVTNILAMCIFGMVTGIIYSVLCLQTGSIFPPVFAHSAVNIMMSQAVLFTVDGGNSFIGPAPTGILSGLPLLVAAVLFLVYMYKHPIQVSANKEA